MALKLKFDSQENVPAELAHLYVERNGVWELDVEPQTELPSATRQHVVARIPLTPEIAPEKRTLRQIAQAREADQKLIGLESEVRRLARAQGLEVSALNKLVDVARGSWRVVNGDLLPVAQDRQTVLLAANGERVLSVAEWVQRQIKGTSPRPSPQSGEGEESLPMRNPFRKRTWNLTEQMKLQHRDAALAKRLKAEAWVEGN